MDATEWRTWINVHMNHFRHGVMLEDLAQPVRDLALAIVRSTMSARGYHHARSIMRINQLIADLSGDHDAFGEWPYFVSIFGVGSGLLFCGGTCANAALATHEVNRPISATRRITRDSFQPRSGIALPAILRAAQRRVGVRRRHPALCRSSRRCQRRFTRAD